MARYTRLAFGFTAKGTYSRNFHRALQSPTMDCFYSLNAQNKWGKSKLAFLSPVSPVRMGARFFGTSSDTVSSSGREEEIPIDRTETQVKAIELVQQQHNEALLSVLREAVGLSSTEDIKNMLLGAKNRKEVERIMQLAYRHHLSVDPLNGHGYRVTILQALTAVAPRTKCLHAWFDAVHRFRQLGFVLTRTFAAEGFTTLRQWLSSEFEERGRSPHLIVEGISYMRELLHWSKEDRLVFDHVLYTRLIFLLTMMVSFLDRQNLYRSSFPAEFVKRDGIVVEWVVSSERCADFDEAVLQCDALLEEVLQLLRDDIPTRPTFSILYRLMDYYFATDNIEQMLAVMEDAESYGMPIAESSTAKLMQLACALNHPAVPSLFLRWRAALPQCVLATPDMSRLLFYYARSGGGHPCPICGEPYNHRYVSVYVWLETPPHQRNCPALQMARKQKGELEECRILPQNWDWSREAWDVWHLSSARSIDWGPVEWRGFLLCCMFGTPEAAATKKYPPPLEAKDLLDRHMAPEHMDDFLRATYMRFLRHHGPHLCVSTLRSWEGKQIRLSPIVLQEALMAAAMICERREENLKQERVEVNRSSGEGKPSWMPWGRRYEDVAYVWHIIREKDSYVMPYTKRVLEARRVELKAEQEAEEEQRRSATVGDASRDPEQVDMVQERRIAHYDKEQALLQEIIEMTPRHFSLLDMKDSASDFAIGSQKKNVFLP